MQQVPANTYPGSPSAQPPAHNNTQERPNCLAAPALNRQYALSENSATVCLDHVSTSLVAGWRRLLSRLTRSHDISFRSVHKRATDPPTRAVAPGQRVLTASFATRGSRVQIPSAPLIPLVRAISGLPVTLDRDSRSCDLDAPQATHKHPPSKHLVACEVLSHYV